LTVKFERWTSKAYCCCVISILTMSEVCALSADYSDLFDSLRYVDLMTVTFDFFLTVELLSV